MAKPIAASKSSGIVYLILALFGLPFALIGVGAAVSLMMVGYDEIRMRFWTEIPCTILSTEIKEDAGSESSTIYVVVQYRYRVNEIDHIGDRVTTTNSSDSIGTFHKRVHAELEEHLKSGRPYRCFVNLSRPEESILFPEGRWQVATLQTWLSLTFCAIGFGLMGVTISCWFDEQKKARNSGAGRTPWMQRTDWAAGEIHYSDRKSGHVVIWIGFAVLSLGIPGLVSSGFALMNRQEWLALIGLIPSGIGVWIFGMGLRQRSRWMRYGDSVLKLASTPGVLGGSLAGVVQTRGKISSPAGYIFRLYCTEMSSSTDSDAGASTSVLWEEEQTIVKAVELTDFEGTAIPVMFVLPYDAPQTNDEPGSDKRHWKLCVRSISTEADYRAEFEVPVFRTSNSKRDFQPDLRAIEKFRGPENSVTSLRKAGLIPELLEGGGIRIDFPRGRHLGFAFSMMIVQALFAVAIGAAFYFKWFSAFPHAASAVGCLLLYAIADQLLFRSEVEATSNALSIRAGIFCLGLSQKIEANEIKRFLPIPAGTSANVAAFDLYVELTTGKKVVFAKRIIPQKLAAEIFRHLQFHLRNSSVDDLFTESPSR